MANNCFCIDDSPKSRQIFSPDSCVICNCDWESKIGHRVAVTLALLEIKRFFLLALEMIIELPILQFSGAVKSVIFSFVDVAVGVPCALAAISSIRKRQELPCYSKVKILLKCVGLIIIICIILNMMTLASIGYHVSVRQSTVKKTFNSSMHLYATDKFYKYNLDEIQIELQCCGHTSYTDWLLFNWSKKVDRGSRKKMNPRAINSVKEPRDSGVPFTCCNIHSMRPCVHMQMAEADVKTINKNGCSKILTHVFIRIAIFGYVITALTIFIYFILLYFIVKITRKPLPQDCPSDCSCLSSEDSSPRCPSIQPVSPCACFSSSSLSVGNETPCPAGKTDLKMQSASKKSSYCWRDDNIYKKNKGQRNRISTSYSSSDLSSFENSYCTNRDTARIRPSTHKQHQLSRKLASKSSSRLLSKVDSR